MESNILQRFLDVGMLAIGSDDEKFTHLQEAARDISRELAAHRDDVIGHTLVALDPTIPPDEPVLTTTEAAIKEHWRTFRNLFPDPPIELLRAVILEALHLAGTADVTVAATVWLTGGSYLPYARLGREKPICTELLVDLGKATETTADDEWSYQPARTAITASGDDSRTAGSGPEAIAVDEIDNQTLADEWTSAATKGPYFPTNNPTEWARAFATDAATSLAAALNTAYGPALEQIVGVLQRLDERFAAANREVADLIGRDSAVGERRVGLLWWKETLYSPTVRRSYRSIEAPAAAPLMAYDLHRQVPAYHPQGVEYLLRETMREAHPIDRRELSERLTLIAVLTSIVSSSEAPELRRALGDARHRQGRIPLLDYMRDALGGVSISPDDFAKRVGVPGDATIGLDDVAVWVFRDLQAHRLAAAS